MPVTAKLSRKFYETFGEDLTNELVELLNNVYTTSRGDLRELNDSNFTRFDGKLAELNGRWEARATLGRIQSRPRRSAWPARVAAYLANVRGLGPHGARGHRQRRRRHQPPAAARSGAKPPPGRSPAPAPPAPSAFGVL